MALSFGKRLILKIIEDAATVHRAEGRSPLVGNRRLPGNNDSSVTDFSIVVQN